MSGRPSYAQLMARTDAPPGSSWGLFPADPERGMANLAGAAEVLAATACVRRGLAFNLNFALDAFDPGMHPGRQPPRHEIISRHEQARDDVLHGLFLQGTTQIDGLRHRRAAGFGFYNGVPDERVAVGTPELGVQVWAERPIVGRGVLLDVDRLLRSRGTPIDHVDGPALSPARLDEALRTQGCDLRVGDLVLVHTGWARWYLDLTTPDRLAVRDRGRATGFRQTRDLPAWAWDRGVALLATDTYAVEVVPAVPDSPYHESAPEDDGLAHQELIGRLGLPLGELWNLTALAEDSAATGQWDCLLVVKPLNLVGGVGSPPNATALR